jgi:hypothetical protein
VRLTILRGLVVLGLLLGLILPSPAQAYVDGGTDPNESDVAVDVRDTWRWVRVTQEGPRVILRVRLYESPPMNDGFRFDIHLDTRGDARRDFVVLSGSSPPHFCHLYRFRPFQEVGGCGYSSGPWHKNSLVGVRWSLIQPVTKRIRWYITTLTWATKSPDPDRAPDHGWYS